MTSEKNIDLILLTTQEKANHLRLSTISNK